MTGYCDGCGNQICLCNVGTFAVYEPTGPSDAKMFDLARHVARIKELKAERDEYKAKLEALTKLDSVGKAGFDHPCRQTCSGWMQGYQRGVEEYKAKAVRLTNLSEELHKFICEHLSTGMVATEQDKLKFDWYAPMQDGTLASYRQEIETHGAKEMGK